MTHTNPGLALACVRSLRSTIERDRLVVVVNRPDLSDSAELNELRKVATIVLPELPSGYGANVNLGVSTLPANVDRVLISNDDVVFASNALETLGSVFEDFQGAAIVGPLITDACGVPTSTCYAFPSLLSELADHLVLPRRVAAWLPRHGVAAPPGVRQFDWVLGAALMIRRSAFDAVGGFDPRYILYSEETDLCRRLANLGWLTLACGDTSAVHVGGASTGGSGIWRIGAESRSLYITSHWTRQNRACLTLLRGLVDAWNLIYALAGLVLHPNAGRPKLGRVALHHRYIAVSWRWRRN